MAHLAALVHFMADSRNSDDARGRADGQIAGPLDGYRLGATDTPVHIYDLTLEGCVVELSFGTLSAESRLQIDLPGEGWTILLCETLHVARHNNYAVQFVGLNDVTRGRLTRAIERVSNRPNGDASVITGETTS